MPQNAGRRCDGKPQCRRAILRLDQACFNKLYPEYRPCIGIDARGGREFLQSELAATKAFLCSELAAAVDRVRSETDGLQLEINRLRAEITQLTLWMGAIAVIAVAAIAMIVKL